MAPAIVVLFALFVGVPIAEIALFILVGERIGVAATIAIVIATALAGAWLVRRQGLETLRRAQRDIENNVVPAGAMAEGLGILIAGVLLLTPGFLTDTIGFLLLVPPLRRRIIAWLGARLAAHATVIDVGVRPHDPQARPGGGKPGGGRVIDVEAVEIPPEADQEGEERSGSSPWRRR